MMARICIGVGADDTRWRCFLHHVFFLPLHWAVVHVGALWHI